MSENYKGVEVGTKKSGTTKRDARGGSYRKTVYKPTVNGRVVGSLASDYEEGAVELAKKHVDRYGA